jgi:Na+/serine symporter
VVNVTLSGLVKIAKTFAYACLMDVMLAKNTEYNFFKFSSRCNFPANLELCPKLLLVLGRFSSLSIKSDIIL